jgi:putative oxidoreductase
MITTRFLTHSFWQSWGLLIARIIVAGVFGIAVFFKFMGIDMTAAAIATAGFPYPLALAWIAAVVELLLVIAFLTGFHFREAAFFSILYILFLGFAFHGPSTWGANPMEFGFFVDHFTFVAGLLYMLAFGPGRFAVRR